MVNGSVALLDLPFETFEHGADIGVRGYGRYLEEAFANGATAMFSIMVDDLASISPSISVEVVCESFAMEGLFVAWLNDLISVADVEKAVFSSFSLVLDSRNFTIEGLAWGDRISSVRAGKGIEVKGATFTQSAVKMEKGLWIAQCVVDV